MARRGCSAARAQEKYVMESEFPPSVLRQQQSIMRSTRPSTTKKIVVSHGAKVISHRKCIIFNAITIIRQFGKLSSAKTFLKEINVASVSAAYQLHSY